MHLCRERNLKIPKALMMVMVDPCSFCHFLDHSRPSQCPPCWAGPSRSHHRCLKPATCKASANGPGHTYLWYRGVDYTVADTQASCPFYTELHSVTSLSVTFKAAVPANEEEADFILVNIAHGFGCTSRTSGGSRVVLGRRLTGESYFRQRCRRHTYISRIYCAVQKLFNKVYILYQEQQRLVSPVVP